jgi:hypothetical protein
MIICVNDAARDPRIYIPQFYFRADQPSSLTDQVKDESAGEYYWEFTSTTLKVLNCQQPYVIWFNYSISCPS